MHWGLKVRGKDGEHDVTRAEYNASFGPRAEIKTPDKPEIPDCLEHLWEWWWCLNARRRPGFDSEAPISYGDISAWINLTTVSVLPEEVEVLVHMDDAYLQALARERQEKRERDESNRGN